MKKGTGKTALLSMILIPAEIISILIGSYRLIIKKMFIKRMFFLEIQANLMFTHISNRKLLIAYIKYNSLRCYMQYKH